MKGIVLVVDDAAGIRDYLHDLLTLLGYQVIEAGHGYEALEMLREYTPALVILDLMMPEMDGVAFAQELQHRHLSYPLVACSASGDAHAFATQINAIGYLEKPFTLAQVHSVISKWRQASKDV